MKNKFTLLLFCTFIVFCSFGQEKPLVYNVENTGAACTNPILPAFDDLPIVNPLTDPFEWSDGSGRDTNFASWSCRRAEIKAEIEHYEIGLKPERPDSITASYTEGVLTVNVTVNKQTLTLTSQVSLPVGDGPFPAVIGMGGGTGSLPENIFSSRNIASVGFNFSQVMAHTQTRGSEPINRLYPELTYMGAYSAWSWGVSRIIDGLELVQADLNIDLNHLAVTGCSFAGKMALYAGAFDERIALTIAQESGGGGAAAWRVSETVGNVETLGATSHAWFIQDLFRFASNKVSKLPFDHHELMAMVAPRALLVLGNPDFEWLADESGYVSCKAAQQVWKNFNISDRFGFSIVGGHGHCALPEVQYPEVESFVEKFLLGNTNSNTNIEISPYADVNHTRWYEWWGNGESYFPEQFIGFTLMFEAECALLGNDWIKASDNEASNAAYVNSKPAIEILKKDSIKESNLIKFPFSVDSSANYTIHARINCTSKENDSFWSKMDDDNYYMESGLTTNGWEWKRFGEYSLEKGDHNFAIGLRENGGQIDKLSISNLLYYEPTERGEPAENICDPKVGINSIKAIEAYALGQNYPNPFSKMTKISFEIPNKSHVSIKVYNTLGNEMAELAGNEYKAGKHSVEFNPSLLSKGIYVYTLRADNFSLSRKMVLQED